MKDYTITELISAITKSFASYDSQGTQHWTWEVAAQDLIYQIGSLHKVILQLSNHRWSDGKTNEQLEVAFRNELADIMAEVLYIAKERSIDMNKAMEEMFADDLKKVTERTN